jgi:hypothetical protein
MAFRLSQKVAPILRAPAFASSRKAIPFHAIRNVNAIKSSDCIQVISHSFGPDLTSEKTPECHRFL